MPLTDPTFHMSGSIDLIVGSDAVLVPLTSKRVAGNSTHPVELETVWMGAMAPNTVIPDTPVTWYTLYHDQLYRSCPH